MPGRQEAEQPDAGVSHQRGVLVAGIGASAGGVETLQAFFGAVAADAGIAFVVVVHLSPEHRSELADILARRTTMPVTQVAGTLPLEADHVYVIPPDRRLIITDHEVSAVPFEEARGQRTPVDGFFRSLADYHGDGFAIVLSGGGSDGAVGIRAIKEAGGLVLVQDPNEAEYDSMPRAAIATGVADLVLPVRELAGRMADLAGTKRRIRATLQPVANADLGADDETHLMRILNHLHARTGHDFSRYKRATVLRRVGRRMQVHGLERLEDYLVFLRRTAEEARELFDDLLISVTHFFRDPDAWEELAEKVIPRLFDRKIEQSPIRAWVPGSATGEEAYSLAMLLHEEAVRRDVWPEIQIFATDLDDAAIAYAREGQYPTAIATDISAPRLDRFFIRSGDHFTVTRALRDSVLFASHSLLRDPPFTRLDLISCRNLLIYLDRELQDQVFSIFRYSLKPGGYLFLGSSEAAESRHFHALHKTHRLYRAREIDAGDPPHLPDALFAGPRGRDQGDHPARTNALPAAHRQLLEQLGPPSVLVDRAGNAVHLSETAGRYLQPPAGPLVHDIAVIARPELQSVLRSGLFRAFEKGEASLSDFVPVRFNGAPVRVAIMVRPRVRRDDQEPLALVVFIEAGAVVAHADGADDGAPEDETMRDLRDELRLMQSRMQVSREEHEAALEELRATNEELQSTNEEYRSTAEELETSREELQSLNEELETVNAELKVKLEEIRRTQSDLENLMVSSHVGILYLDRNLRVGRFTPKVAALFSITPADRGRPIGDFSRRFEFAGFEEAARKVLDSLVPVEHEIGLNEDEWCLLRLRPYRTIDGRIDGVVATFVDITDLKRSEVILRRAHDYASSIVNTVREPLLVLTADMRVQSANASFYNAFRLDRAHTDGASFFSLGNGHFDIPALRRLLEDVLSNDQAFSDFEITHGLDDGATRTLRLNGRRLDRDSILLAIEDVTQQVAADRQRQDLLDLARAQARAEIAETSAVRNSFMATMSHELRTPLNAIIGYAQLLVNGIPDPIAESARSHAERIRLSSNHLLQLIDEILTFSRIENGHETASSEPIDVDLLLREVCAMIEPLARERLLDFNLTVPETLGTIQSDPRKLRQILLNLAANAVKFTKHGTIEIRVDRQDGAIRFEVRDSGIGIRADDLHRIFDPFWQVSPTRMTERPDGTGLGLAIVHRFVTQLGGRIDVESELGQGTVFRILVPVGALSALTMDGPVLPGDP